MKTKLNLFLPIGLALVSCALFSTGSAQEAGAMAPRGEKSPPVKGYLDAQSIDYASVVPPVPTAGSLEQLTDLETLLRIQDMRTAAEVKWANAILKADAFSNADIIGPWFKAESLPLTAALLKKSGSDAVAATNVAKDYYKRTRPYVVDPDIKPCVALPGGYSYPSGFAMSVWVRAGVLAILFPDKGPQLLEKARENSWARIVGGVHYPSDVVSGRLLAKRVVANLLKNPDFRADLERARAEVAAAGK